MATLTQYSGLLSMTAADAVDHAAQFGGNTAFKYTWTPTQAGLTITARSLAGNITFNATQPLGGRIHGIEVYSGISRAYDVAGMNGSLVAMTAAPNLEGYWRSILAGPTTLIASGIFTGSGDFINVAVDETATGRNDVFQGIDTTSKQSFAGDAMTVGDNANFTGGDDTFNVRGPGSAYGDSVSAAGFTTGGDDRFVIDGNNVANTLIVGDVREMVTDPTPGFAQGILGGDDEIVILNAGADNIVVGDVHTMGSDFGSVVGGNDLLDARQLAAAVSLYGDVFTVTGSSMFLRGGDDTIFLPDFASLNQVSGDAGAGGTVTLSGGNDTIVGGTGSDTLYGEAIDAFSGGAMLQDKGNDLLRGRGGDDNLFGQAGADTLDGGLGNDTLDGGDFRTFGFPTADLGNNTATFENEPLAVFVDLADGFAMGQGFDALVRIQNVRGSALADTIAGDTGANRLTGLGGDDALWGRDGNDTLDGGGGADTLVGGAGDDTYTNPAGDEIAEAASGGTADLVRSNTSFSLAPVANVERLELVGSAGINGTGNDLANVITGNSGVNILNGGAGADTLVGGGGKDQLIGGKNNDVMNGGAAADTFRFAVANTGNDTINGFETALDRFDLTGGTFSAVTEIAGNTRLTHAGGLITITGITGLTLTQWNAMVLPSGGTASEGAAPHGEAWPLTGGIVAPAHLAFAGHVDFL